MGEHLDVLNADRESHGEKPNFQFYNLGSKFTKLRHSEGHERLLGLPNAEIRHVLSYFSEAVREAAAGKRILPKPKYRKSKCSFTIPQSVEIENNRLRISKVGCAPVSRGGDDPWAHGTAK